MKLKKAMRVGVRNSQTPGYTKKILAMNGLNNCRRTAREKGLKRNLESIYELPCVTFKLIYKYIFKA